MSLYLNNKLVKVGTVVLPVAAFALFLLTTPRAHAIGNCGQVNNCAPCADNSPNNPSYHKCLASGSWSDWALIAISPE